MSKRGTNVSWYAFRYQHAADIRLRWADQAQVVHELSHRGAIDGSPFEFDNKRSTVPIPKEKVRPNSADPALLADKRKTRFDQVQIGEDLSYKFLLCARHLSPL
jgi:hypothetical protein